MRLFIDDQRTPIDFENWVVARNAKEAITELRLCRNRGEELESISYDHDLGMDGSIRTVVNWQVRNGVRPQSASVHSSNPVGREWLFAAMERDFGSPVPIVDPPEFVGGSYVSVG